MSTPPPDLECEVLGGLEYGLGVFLLVGTVISYLPQHLKLWRKKTHVGLSLGTAILGSLTGSATLSNYMAQQYAATFDCCRVLSSRDCFGVLMPFLQLICIWVCTTLIMFMYLLYFDRSWLDEHGVPAEKQWRTAKVVVSLSLAAQASVFLTYALLASIAGVYADSTNTFGQVCAILASIGMIVHWAPQIWRTFRLKRIGSLSLPMIFLQTVGAALTAYFFSLSTGESGGWEIWLPFAIAAVLLGVLFVLALYYYCKERRFNDHDYVVVNDDESESIYTHRNLYSQSS